MKDPVKNMKRQAFLVDWIQIHLPEQVHGFNPWFRKIPHTAEKLKPGATTTEPKLWAQGLQLPGPLSTVTEAQVPWSQQVATTEPVCCNYWSPRA